jgi:hypothetical protein
MATRRKRPKSPPSDRQINALVSDIVAQIVEADRAGMNYISPIIDGELSLTDLFDKKFPPIVRNRVYQQLELEEQKRTP